LAGLLPCLHLSPGTHALVLQLVVAGGEFGDGLLGKKLLQRPLLNVLGLVLLELGDELNCTLQYRAFVLLATRHDLG